MQCLGRKPLGKRGELYGRVVPASGFATPDVPHRSLFERRVETAQPQQYDPAGRPLRHHVRPAARAETTQLPRRRFEAPEQLLSARPCEAIAPHRHYAGECGPMGLAARHTMTMHDRAWRGVDLVSD